MRELFELLIPVVHECSMTFAPPRLHVHTNCMFFLAARVEANNFCFLTYFCSHLNVWSMRDFAAVV